MNHKYVKRDNASCTEIKGVPMYKCNCGKSYQTKAQAEQHCRRQND
jgi:hypothetical protein